MKSMRVPHFLLFLGVAPLLIADTVVLVNGDRITGAVKRLEDGKLTLISDLLGTVRVDWSDIESVQSDGGRIAILDPHRRRPSIRRAPVPERT